jgi:hypothetical protein
VRNDKHSTLPRIRFNLAAVTMKHSDRHIICLCGQLGGGLAVNDLEAHANKQGKVPTLSWID